MAIEFNDRLRQIPTYPVASGYALPDDVALLASNESPDPPLPQVVEAAARALAGANRYPDPSYSLLRRRLSDRYEVPASQIAVGNGSADLLLSLGAALLEPGAEVVYAWPSFSVYPHLAAATGARAVQVPLNAAFEHDLDAMLREVTAATRMVLVCNPNNPTSTALPLDRIADFVAQVPRNVAVVLDEAYCEFTTLDDPDASIDLLKRHTNLVLLRTFSKVYGLAGMRTGFGLCGSEAVVDAVGQVRQPFFLNVAAQAAAIEALRHQDEVLDRVERAIVARVEVESGLNALGIEPAESQTNFCWFDLPEHVREDEVVAGLRERGVLVRAGAALGREGALRVTFGTGTHNARFLDALRQVL